VTRIRTWLSAVAALGLVAPQLIGSQIATAAPAPGASAGPDSGALVSVEPLPLELSLPGVAVAEKIEYRTQWRSGEPTVATGALFVPDGDAPDGGWPVVAWAHGTTGVGDDCSLTTRTPRSDVEKMYLGHWLDQGYAVVAADYPGLGSEGLHRYLDGRSAANSVVDSVRAGRAADPSLSDRWVVIGHSQGGHAALHTADIATSRAPELDFRGTVATGAPANLESAFTLGVPGFPDPGLWGLVSFSGYLFSGVRDAYPDVDIDSYFTPAGREILDQAEVLCYDDLDAVAQGVNIGELPARPMSEGELPAVLADYLAVPTSGYDRPIFLGHGVHDVMVPIPLSAKLAADMTASGTDVDYRVYMAGHFTAIERSMPDTTPFVAQLLAQ
jgi:predicted esterase